MARVHVLLETAKVRLEFRGAEALFQRAIESILLGAAGRRPRGAVETPAPVVPTPAPAEPLEEPEVEPPMAHPEPPGFRPTTVSFGTFLRQVDEQRDEASYRVAAYAFYLWNYERKEVFLEDEIRGCFAASDEPFPQQPADAYAELIDRRLVEAAGEGSWRLTPKGRNRVRKTLR